MPRPVGTTLQELLDAPSCQTQTTLELRLLSGETVRYCTKQISIELPLDISQSVVSVGGSPFTDDLRTLSEIVQSAFASVDRTNAKVQNADKVFGLKVLSGDIDKAVAIVGRYYRDEQDESKTTWVELFRGEAEPNDVTPTECFLEIVDDLVAAGYCVASSNYAEPDFDYAEDVVDDTPPVGGGGGGGGGGLDGDNCFAGDTLIELADGRRIEMRYLYARRCEFIGQKAKTFDEFNNIAAGEILDVFRSLVYELLEVRFKGEPQPMYMVKNHRFWTENKEFIAMCNLSSEKLFTHEKGWNFAEVENVKLVGFPDGVEVFNLTVAKFHAYFATASGGAPKAVSNSKRIGGRDTF